MPPAAVKGQAPPPNSSMLLGFQRICSVLCAMMVIWIVLYPGTWVVTVQPHLAGFHKRATAWVPIFVLCPSDLFSKYKGRPILLVHLLPCLLWCAAMLAQLNDGLRARRPRLHRALGYATAAATLASVASVPPLLARGLVYSAHPGSIATFAVVAALFCTTVVCTVRAARAADFVAHRRWAMRHAALGAWSPMDRIIALLVGPFVYGSGLVPRDDDMARGHWLAVNNGFALAVCLGAVEGVLWSEHRAVAAGKAARML